MSDKPKKAKPKKAAKTILWVPQHRACALLGDDKDRYEVRYYDPNDPPPGAPGSEEA